MNERKRRCGYVEKVYKKTRRCNSDLKYTYLNKIIDENLMKCFVKLRYQLLW